MIMVGDRYFLVSESGDAIDIAPDLLVGRESQCGLTLDSTEVSRRHAQFHVTSTGVSLEDMQSMNGTFIQGKRLEGIQDLHHGDELRFGSCVFEFRCESEDVAAMDTPSEHPEVMSPVREDPLSEVGKPDEAKVGKPNEDGRQGSIEVMPRNKNLPPAWIDEGRSHTAVLSLTDEKRTASGQDVEELAEWEINADGPTLLILSGKDAGLPYQLHNSGELSFWTIGKGGASHDLSIVIDDPSVSNYHAKLVYKAGRWKVIDQMSTNHTYVNGEQYNSAFLSPNDSIRFGGVNTKFLLPNTGEADAPAEGPKKGGFRLLRKLFGGS